MDVLISSIAASGNLAVVVSTLWACAATWLVRHLLQTVKEMHAERSIADKANSEADLKIAEALIMLRMELTRSR